MLDGASVAGGSETTFEKLQKPHIADCHSSALLCACLPLGHGDFDSSTWTTGSVFELTSDQIWSETRLHSGFSYCLKWCVLKGLNTDCCDLHFDFGAVVSCPVFLAMWHAVFRDINHSHLALLVLSLFPPCLVSLSRFCLPLLFFPPVLTFLRLTFSDCALLCHLYEHNVSSKGQSQIFYSVL